MITFSVGRRDGDVIIVKPTSLDSEYRLKRVGAPPIEPNLTFYYFGSNFHRAN